MEHYLSLERIQELKAELKQATPYPTDTISPVSFDGERDFARAQATMAKLLKIVFNMLDGSIQSTPLPPNYRWCTTHICQARRRLEQMVRDGRIPEQRNIIWNARIL